MSLFRKQPQTATELNPAEQRGSTEVHAFAAPAQPLFNGSAVDFAAIYHASKLPADELDRVTRAEALLQTLPTTASQAREVVDATLRAFGVERAKILSAAGRQLEALEAFVHFSHDQSQRIMDVNAQRIAELDGEIERCRKVSAQATTEGEERARSVNELLRKLQRVLEFFGDDRRAATEAGLEDAALDEDTMLNKTRDGANAMKTPPRPPGKASQSTSNP